MRSDWTDTKLGELVDVAHGWAFKGRYFREPNGELPIVVKPGNFRPSGGLDFDYARTQAYGGAYPAEYELQPGDLLVVMTCQTRGGEILGVPGEVPDGNTRYLHNQRLGKVKVRNDAAVDRRFLYWLLNDWSVRRELVGSATGSTVLHTSPSRIEAVPVRLPGRTEQEQIAWILGSLDDKIENNRQIAKTLEEIATRLFKARFVDFVDQDDLVETKIGPIPSGWVVGKLGDIAINRRDTVDPQAEADREYEHFSFPAFDAGREPEIVKGSELKSAKLQVASDCVLLSKLNPKWQRVWWPRPSKRGVPVCSPEFVVLQPKPGVSHAFLYATARSNPRLRSHILSHATGTTGSRQRVRPGEILRAEIAIPPEGEIEKISHPLAKLFAREEAALEESRALTAIRDALLPRLISGQLRVPATDPEKSPA